MCALFHSLPVLIFVLLVSVFVPAQLYMRIPVSVAFRNYTENSRRWKIGLLSSWLIG